MAAALSLPLVRSATYDSPGFSSVYDAAHFGKFPHTCAQLLVIARQCKPFDNCESDAEGDDLGRVKTSLVNKVVALLDGEREDELKALLKGTYNMDNEAV